MRRNHEQPTRPQDRRPDPGDRRGDAGAPDQGPAARLRHRSPTSGSPATPSRPRSSTPCSARTSRPRRHGRRAGVGQGADPLRGRQAARHAARAVADVRPRRAARRRPATSTRCWPRPRSPTRRSAARRAARRTPARPTRTRSRARSTTTTSRRRARRAATRPVTESGLVVVDKPGGMTSHDVVARVRRLAGTRKVGHAGTLDPMATGVLVLGVDRATRLLGHLMLTEKAYDATVRLGRRHHHRRRRGRGRRDGLDGRRSTRRRSRDALRRVRRRHRAGADRGLGDQGRRQARLPAGPRRRGGRARAAAGHRPRARRARRAPRRETSSTSTSRVRCSSGTYIRAIARDLGARARRRRPPDRAAAYGGRPYDLDVRPHARRARRAASRCCRSPRPRAPASRPSTSTRSRPPTSGSAAPLDLDLDRA